MKTNKFQDIKRSELLDKLAAGWIVRRKSWPDYAKVCAEFDEGFIGYKDLKADDWEGHPPEPQLKLHVHSVHLEKALSFMRHYQKTGNAFMIKTGADSKFIGWYNSQLWYFKDDFKTTTTEVKFNGSLDLFYSNWSVYVRE